MAENACDAGKYLYFPSEGKSAPGHLSNLSYRVCGGLNPPQGIRNLFLIEFTLCHIPIRDACTWNSWWIETRNALLSSIPTADPSFRTGYMQYFRIFHRIATLCASTWYAKFAKLWRIIEFFFFFFFEHYQVYGKLHLFSIFKIPSFRSLCKFNLKYRQFRNVFCKLSNDSWSLNRLLLLVI